MSQERMSAKSESGETKSQVGKWRRSGSFPLFLFLGVGNRANGNGPARDRPNNISAQKRTFSFVFVRSSSSHSRMLSQSWQM
jgi:hypothetical protein